MSLQHGACWGGSCPPIWGFTPCSSRELWLCFMLLILLSPPQKSITEHLFCFSLFNWGVPSLEPSLCTDEGAHVQDVIHSALPFFVFLMWFLVVLPVSWLFRAWDICILHNPSERWKSFARLCTHGTELAAFYRWVSEMLGMISGERFSLWILCLMN